ncbi:MAG: molybdopterin dinucleotide binding domain-containing protein [Gammaproteobacteria bacterium]
MIARVQITNSQQQSGLFVPMHWTGQYASQGRMGALVNPVVDPVSKQPESKHTPVQIKAYQPHPAGLYLVAPGTDHHRFRLPGQHQRRTVLPL